MEEVNLEDLYKIDKDRLLKYYERIKNQYKSLGPTEIIAQFLFNQSVGPSDEDILIILNYFKEKLNLSQNLLDFAFEWIRAQTIRLEYKKYIIRADYPIGHLSLAIDDCISMFFLKYDRHLRKLLKDDIYEHEISALYHIFFSIFEKDFDSSMILELYKNKVPTIVSEDKKLDTSIITLRLALSLIIVKDYESVLVSRSESLKETSEFEKQISSKEVSETEQFKGALVERMIKTYCVKKGGLASKEIESAVTQFLSSYFKFGKFYNYDDFKSILTHSLAAYIFSGLTDYFKQFYSINEIKTLISKAMTIFKDTNKFDMFDGLAWINDLKPYIKVALLDFAFHLIEDNIKEVSAPIEMISQSQESSQIDQYDFESNFDLSLEVDEFRTQLEENLKNSNIGLIERVNIVRNKVQEFQTKKRKVLK